MAKTPLEKLLDGCKRHLITGLIQIKVHDEEGRIILRAGVVDDATWQDLKGNDAIEKLLELREGRYLLAQRLPDLSGELGEAAQADGNLEEIPLVTIMRHCEDEALSCTITVISEFDRGQITYHAGEITKVTLNERSDEDAIVNIVHFEEGKFRISAPPLPSDIKGWPSVGREPTLPFKVAVPKPAVAKNLNEIKELEKKRLESQKPPELDEEPSTSSDEELDEEPSTSSDEELDEELSTSSDEELDKEPSPSSDEEKILHDPPASDLDEEEILEKEVVTQKLPGQNQENEELLDQEVVNEALLDKEVVTEKLPGIDSENENISDEKVMTDELSESDLEDGEILEEEVVTKKFPAKDSEDEEDTDDETELTDSDLEDVEILDKDVITQKFPTKDQHGDTSDQTSRNPSHDNSSISEEKRNAVEEDSGEFKLKKGYSCGAFLMFALVIFGGLISVGVLIIMSN